MRVLHRDPKTGEIKMRVENPDDLWHLHNLLLPGDLVRASTTRREEVKSDKVRPERGEKVRVTLTIRVEGVEFQAFSDRLRITGVIVDGPQDLGRHHTLNIGVEDVLYSIGNGGYMAALYAVLVRGQLVHDRQVPRWPLRLAPIAAIATLPFVLCLGFGVHSFVATSIT